MLKGIDVSSYQSTSYSTAGLSFVGIKVTEGLSYVNPHWVGQRATARAAGLVTIFYAYPHITNSPAAEADYFLSQINLAAGDILCLDWEWYGQSATEQQARDYKDAWLAYVRAKAPGHRVIVYADRNSWLNVDTNSNAGDGLWIADYVTAGQPRVKAKWLFHQYSDQPQDMDVANFATVADLKAWAGAAAPAPTPKPTPAPSTPQWQKLLDHVMSVPEQVYEHWKAAIGWDNVTAWGAEYGEQGVAWCAIWNWCMFHDVGLDGVVPKTDNVTAFSDWAKARGQWSEYPSVGAWVNFDNGGHTEIVIGFDDQRVFTKGGNSIQAGSQDRGQGNGVWTHEELRRATRVTGYFAPHFAGGCPPTADPHDPRGGTAVTSYTPPEDDMTPAQAQQLQDLHDLLTNIGSLTETDPKTKQPVSHGAGYYLAHAQADTAALTKAVAAVGAQSAANGQSLTKALAALTAISTAVTAGGSADTIVAAVKAELEAWHPTITITG